MKYRTMKLKNNKLASAIVAVSCASVLSVVSLAWAAPEVILNSNNMTVSAAANEVVYVRIAGPNGYTAKFKGNSIAQWSPAANAPDGDYRYDSYSTKASSEDTEQTNENGSSRKSGTFTIESGVIVDPQADTILLEESSINSKNIFEKAMISFLNTIIPTVSAAQLQSTDATPAVVYIDTTLDDGPDWATFGVQDTTTTRGRYQIADLLGVNNHGALTIEATAGSTNNQNSLVVNTAGDITLANSAVFIDRSSDQMGLGTTTPAGSLHITNNGFPELVLENNGDSAWELEANSTGIEINENNGARIFSVEEGAPTGSLIVDTTGNIGLGTTSPDKGLHIIRDDGKGTILVQENASTNQKRYQVQLENNGPTGFRFTNTANSSVWQFSQTPAGGFTFANTANGGQDFAMNSDGRVLMGPGPVTNFNLSPSGDLVIPNGSVTANGILLTSSRATKTDISAIKPAEVMEKLKQVEVAEWRYKTADKNDRHISPMAEDFYSLFKLGPSNRYINPNDLASVAIIAAKELQKKSEKMDAETASLKTALSTETMELKAENASLKERLSSLEKLVTNLASGQELLPESGDTVVLNNVK